MTTQRSAQRPGILRRAISALLGLAIALSIGWATAEILLRLFRPQLTGPIQGEFNRDLGILPKPGTVTWRSVPPFYSYSSKHDSAGRRIVAHQPLAPSANVLFLGDSFTYGSGVGDDQTFSSVTQGLLVEAGANVRVLNAGNSGIGTDFELRYFQLRGAAEKPAVVDLFFFGNDYTDNAEGRFFDVQPDGSVLPKTLREGILRRAVAAIPAHDFLMSHSHTVALLRSLPVRVQVATLEKQREINRKTRRPVAPANERLASIYLRRLASAVRDSGATFRVFYIPSMEDIEAFRAAGQQPQDEMALARICSAQTIEMTSLTRVVASAPRQTNDLYFGEGHWKPFTHSLVSPAIAAAVQQDLMRGAAVPMTRLETKYK